MSMAAEACRTFYLETTKALFRDTRTNSVPSFDVKSVSGPSVQDRVFYFTSAAKVGSDVHIA